MVCFLEVYGLTCHLLSLPRGGQAKACVSLCTHSGSLGKSLGLCMFLIWNSLLFPVGTSSLARSTFTLLALERGIQVSVVSVHVHT